MKGGCLCGAIRYEIQGAPLFSGQCCCRDCQKATGTGHVTIIGVHNSQLAITGTPQTYTSRGGSGGSVTRHFCGVCGGRIYTSGDQPGEVVMVQAGSLDEPNQVSPQTIIYVRDAAAWDFLDPALQKFETFPVFETAPPGA